MLTFVKGVLVGTCLLGAVAGYQTIPASTAYFPSKGVLYTEQSTGDYIGEAKAKEIAAKDAGYEVNEVTFTNFEEQFGDGFYRYKVEFTYGEMVYDYRIDAKTGAITAVAAGELNDEYYDD